MKKTVRVTIVKNPENAKISESHEIYTGGTV